MSDPNRTTGRGLDDPRNVSRIFWALLAICLATVGIEPFFLSEHPHYAYERWIGFHGAFGFAAFFLIVLAGKQWRRVVGRGKDYYDE